jgi:hypothetical protein
MEESMETLKTVTSSHLASAAIVAALVSTLQSKGLLSDQDVKDTYEHALLMIEAQQSESEMAEIYEAARELIEQHLRPDAG